MKAKWRASLRWTVVALLGLGVAFYAWTQDTYAVDPIAYASALADRRVRIEERRGYIVIEPAVGEARRALLFYPGLRVEPRSYVPKLAEVAVATQTEIVVGRPRLNVAAFSISQADDMRNVLSRPAQTQVYVGGHSLGGAMACLFAQGHAAELAGVVLLGTYCGSDIANSQLRVLSLIAENDMIMPAETIEQHRAELPFDALVVRVAGMRHSQFGNYGGQRGEDPADIDDGRARDAIVSAMNDFFTSR